MATLKPLLMHEYSLKYAHNTGYELTNTCFHVIFIITIINFCFPLDHGETHSKEEEPDKPNPETGKPNPKTGNPKPETGKPKPEAGKSEPEAEEPNDIFADEHECSGGFWVDYEYLSHRCFEDEVENVQILVNACVYVKKMDEPFQWMSREGYLEIGKNLTRFIPIMRCVNYIADMQEKYLNRTCNPKIPGFAGCLCDGEREKVGKCRQLFPTSQDEINSLKAEMKEIMAEARKYRKKKKEPDDKTVDKTEVSRLLRELAEQLEFESK
ncbi:hypothetical protein ACF0H5_006193 [Mactra antiquata]